MKNNQKPLPSEELIEKFDVIDFCNKYDISEATRLSAIYDAIMDYYHNELDEFYIKRLIAKVLHHIIKDEISSEYNIKF